MVKLTEDVKSDVNDLSTEIANDILEVLMDKYDGTPMAIILGAIEAAKVGLIRTQLAD